MHWKLYLQGQLLDFGFVALLHVDHGYIPRDGKGLLCLKLS